MAKAIDKEFDVTFYTDIKQKDYKIMNDYTHTGANQIARNFSELEPIIDSNFSSELILDTLKSSNNLLKTAIVVFLENIGLHNGFISKNEMDASLEY